MEGGGGMGWEGENLPIQFRDDLADSLSSTSGGWNNVLSSTSTIPPFLTMKDNNNNNTNTTLSRLLCVYSIKCMSFHAAHTIQGCALLLIALFV